MVWTQLSLWKLEVFLVVSFAQFPCQKELDLWPILQFQLALAKFFKSGVDFFWRVGSYAAFSVDFFDELDPTNIHSISSPIIFLMNWESFWRIENDKTNYGKWSNKRWKFSTNWKPINLKTTVLKSFKVFDLKITVLQSP